MTSPISAGLAVTLEHRICKPLSLPNLLTWRGQGQGRGRGEAKCKRHAWTSAVPQWAARGENCVPRSCRLTKSMSEKSHCQDLTPKCKNILICYFLFCRHHGYWVYAVRSADVIPHPSKHWPPFMSVFSEIFTFFFWKDRRSYRSHLWYTNSCRSKQKLPRYIQMNRWRCQTQQHATASVTKC